MIILKSFVFDCITFFYKYNSLVKDQNNLLKYKIFDITYLVLRTCPIQ